MARARENPSIGVMTSDYYETKPQIKVAVDRARATDLGVFVARCGRDPADPARLAPRDHLHRPRRGIQRGPAGCREKTASRRRTSTTSTYARISSGLVPLASLVRLEERAGPPQLLPLRPLPLAPSSFPRSRPQPRPHASPTASLDYMNGTVADEDPRRRVLLDRVLYDGESRDFEESSRSLIYFSLRCWPWLIVLPDPGGSVRELYPGSLRDSCWRSRWRWRALSSRSGTVSGAHPQRLQPDRHASC